MIFKTFRQFVLTTAAILVLGFSSDVYCQDLIKNIQMLDTSSIVRTIDESQHLVYNHGKENSFCIVDPYGSNVITELLYKDDMKILDFEIFEGYVYFCGIENIGSPNSIFGYFKLSDFPYATVYYDVRDEWASFNKLDVFEIEDQRHVVMTATYHNGYGTMLDVRENTTGGWVYCDADFEDCKFSFYDVAVIDEYVVFSSIGDFDDIVSKTDVDLWYIKKPLGSGVPIFNNVSGNMYRLSIFVSVFGEILIEHIEGNELAVVHKGGNNTDFKVSYLDGMNYQNTTIVACDASCVVKDIKRSGIIDEVVVLVNNTSIMQALKRSVLYVIPYNSPGPFVMVPRRYSQDELLNSIDWIFWHSFVGSGHEYLSQDFHAYFFNMQQSGSCLDNLSEKEEVKESEYISSKIEFPQRSFPYLIDTINHDTLTIKANIVCD